MLRVWNHEGLIQSGQRDHESEEKDIQSQFERRINIISWLIRCKDWSRGMMSQRWLNGFKSRGGDGAMKGEGGSCGGTAGVCD